MTNQPAPSHFHQTVYQTGDHARHFAISTAGNLLQTALGQMEKVAGDCEKANPKDLAIGVGRVLLLTALAFGALAIAVGVTDIIE